MWCVSLRSPEVHLREVALALVQLDPFHEEEVFPKRPGIVSSRERSEVVDQAIAYPEVGEVDLLPLLQLVAEMSRVGGDDADEAAEFELRDVALDRFPIEPHLLTERFVVNLRADAVGQMMQEVDEDFVLSDLREPEEVFKED